MYVPTLCHVILRSDGASLESDHQQPVRGVDIKRRLEGLPTVSKSGGTGFQTEKITRARTCVGLSLALSRKEGHPERSFPEISAYSGVMGPKVRHFYDSYIYIWIVSRMNVIKILCPIVDSSYPWRVEFIG